MKFTGVVDRKARIFPPMLKNSSNSLGSRHWRQEVASEYRLKYQEFLSHGNLIVGSSSTGYGGLLRLI